MLKKYSVKCSSCKKIIERNVRRKINVCFQCKRLKRIWRTKKEGKTIVPPSKDIRP